ncbi:MarR family winged helix-turn-helix transcriptional regulator [Cellulomonas wangsupingiae]|uniref:MarR family winged helix-turn-helix transcriptional regulator n=1 Tax=Cellulomonas wangsupingiae TaxID=2968085 RepID=UPI001D0E5832|nr:MarR family transcriptional regulator [Cellulomonas wangsupingiae]MCM0639414.1 MarR family transcriptional regulator [Cellulomonas wangsupingiae]
MVDDEPRWLSTDETNAWIALSALTTHLPHALDTQLQRDAGISLAEYHVLSWLSMAPDRTHRMRDLAARADVSLSHLSRIVARLEARGWIRRHPDPTDGRTTLATLTDAGWDKVVATAPGHVAEARRRVFDRLDDAQVGHLAAVARQVVEACGVTLPRVDGD